MRAISFLRLHPDARVPTQAHPGDAGFDLHAVEAIDLAPGARASIGCGFAMALPDGTAGLVVPRSGIALRHGVTVLNAPGLIDAGYRGEVRVLLVNHGDDTVPIGVGDRIAQLVVVDCTPTAFAEVDALPETRRGTDGFGSTGVRP